MADGPKPVEISQAEGRSHDASGHPYQDAPSTVNRAVDDATHYTSHPQNFDATHAADADPPIKIKLPD